MTVLAVGFAIGAALQAVRLLYARRRSHDRIVRDALAELDSEWRAM